MAHIDEYIQNIVKLRAEADELPEDNPGALLRKINLLTTCLMYIGRVSSQIDGDYKRKYAERKYEQAKAHREAAKDKAASAEIAVKDLRQEEADLYQNMSRWRNALSSTTEELHALKLKLKIDFQQGA
ncbi:hypothetical protein [Paenibacillus sabinae]|uniref:Uncharacterized protein n=1 Tax=Paenibacillus sabinae T27 TaxID=1268072 RepID=X4ZHA7_9BACL|nr:hypothetical protein [Paenibacillus sabinae]AHV96125.1 hypothetical protein PSAB_05945 [Paenibacillus sabinae T27]